MTTFECLWHPPPTDLTLSSNDVHVWRADLDLPTWQIERLAQTFSADEHLRADKFYFERDRRHFIAGRGLLRVILGRYLDLEPTQLQFSYGARGKPALAIGTGRKLCFNLSHSNGLVLYAVTRDRDLGIDLEHIRPLPEAEQLARRFFSAREYAVISSLPFDQKQEAFFKGWTRKEAYLKASGDGLAQPLERVEVSLAPSEPAKLYSIKGDASAAARWFLQDLTPALGYVAALAVEGHRWRLTCWQCLA